MPTNGHDDSLSPEEARDLLAKWKAEDVDEERAAAEHSWLTSEVQLELIRGGPESLGHLVCELYWIADACAHGGHHHQAEAISALEQRLLEKIWQSAELKLAQEGLPEPWEPHNK